jgi:hypothetical protein
LCKKKQANTKPSLVVLAVSGRAFLQPKLLRRLRQKDLKLEASLGYTVGPCLKNPKLLLNSKTREVISTPNAAAESLNYKRWVHTVPSA